MTDKCKGKKTKWGNITRGHGINFFPKEPQKKLGIPDHAFSPLSAFKQAVLPLKCAYLPSLPEEFLLKL